MNLDKITKYDREDKILKRSKVLLMPLIWRNKCSSKEELIDALKAEKLYWKFIDGMQRVYWEEEYYKVDGWLLFGSFMNDLWALIEQDFIKIGKRAESIIASMLREKGFVMPERTVDQINMDEGRGIDLVASKGGRTWYFSVKSWGFWYSDSTFITKQLNKMIANIDVLFLVNKENKEYKAFTKEQLVEIQELRMAKNPFWKAKTK